MQITRSADEAYGAGAYCGEVPPAFLHALRARADSVVGDVAIGVGSLIVTLGAIAIATRTVWLPWEPESYVVTAITVALVLGLSRRLPLAALLIAAIVVAWPFWMFGIVEVRVVPLVIAVYRAAAAGRRLRIIVPVTIIAFVAGVWPLDGWVWWVQLSLDPIGDLGLMLAASDPSRLVLTTAVLASALLLGAAVARQRRIAEELRRRNEELVELRDADRRRVAMEERTVIAREIHDVVAHHVSAIVIRAQAAERVADLRPAEPRLAVQQIAASGQEALTAMRRVVRVLRTDAGPVGVDGTTLEAEIAASVDRVRQAGVHVESDVRPPDGLTEYEQTVLLRIAQEALTNVMIHAEARSVRIELLPHPEGARLLVTDDGIGAERNGHDSSSPVGSGGMGLAGMAERALSVGGRVEAGPADVDAAEGTGTHGWRVEAIIPVAVGARP